MIQSSACEELQRYVVKDVKTDVYRMPFFGQMCHMAQLAEILNAIKEFSLYPSLASMASVFTVEEFNISFNHVRDGNKN